MSSQTLAIGLALFASSFWGSWHCAAMCGPMASLAARNNSYWDYHLGRGFSYAIMGMASGYVGSFLLKNELYVVRIFSAATLVTLLAWMGIQTLRGETSLTAPKWRGLHFFYRRQQPSLLLGLTSVFLPCGWLYSYVVAAMATRSWHGGAVVMLLFWLGGLPALSALSLFVKRSIHQAPVRTHKAAGLILIGASLYSIISFYYMP